jgi:hypothetical protein
MPAIHPFDRDYFCERIVGQLYGEFNDLMDRKINKKEWYKFIEITVSGLYDQAYEKGRHDALEGERK